MRYVSLAILVLLTGTACSSGAGSDGDLKQKSETGIVALFAADRPNPEALTVAMGESSRGADQVTVVITVTGTSAIFAALFEVTFDDSEVEFVSPYTPGTLFESGGPNVVYFVNEVAPGRLTVDATRLGGDGVDVPGTMPLVYLTFRATAAASTAISFENAILYDDQPPTPQPISGLSWFGGTLVAN